MAISRRKWLPADRARSAAAALGVDQCGVVSRRQLVAAGVPRWLLRAELSARRWQVGSEQTIVLHNGPLSDRERRWVGVLGTTPRAALDGVTALQAAGLKGLHDTDVHVIAPRGSEPRSVAGVITHESRRFREQDVVTVGIRRMKPAVAAVHAALWAVSDRQATLFVLMCSQQRLASVAELAAAVATIRRHRRRRLLRQLVLTLREGIQSLGELDVAADFRRRGFPEPDRQTVRRRPSGTEYLDCELRAYKLVLELDGLGHEQPAQQLSDLLRDLAVAADGQTVIRIPMTAYCLDRERVLDRLEALLRARGWQGSAAA